MGVGLLGGSIGLAYRSRVKDCHVVGYGHRRESLETARRMGAVDEISTDPLEAVREASLVILCTPVSLLSPLLKQIAPGLTEGAVVTDVGSTKSSVVESAERLMPPIAHFVGSHPMAGSEKRGVQFARTNLFDTALCILTPTSNTMPDALRRVDEFWQLLGMRTVRLSPAEHDRRLAEVSHLPHALAAALVLMSEQGSLDLSGKGFADLTRIAGGDPGLWRDILLDNRDNVRASIARLRDQLEGLQSLLDAGDAEGLHRWLATAAARRQAMIERNQLADGASPPGG